MTYPNLLTTNEAAELEDLEELQAWRDGARRLAEDPMHAGQPVHEIYRHEDGESIYRLQITHADTPVWQCDLCRKLTVSASPAACVGCGKNAIESLIPLLYEQEAACRDVASIGASQYDGPCLIAGSDGCDCTEVD